MAAELLSFFRRTVPAKSGDWSSQEIAEFYRVEAALVQAGLSLVVDRGLTDEGDPWFVFCRAGDGEVIVHFARIAGSYLIAADSVGHPISGQDFRALLSQFVALHPSLIPVRTSQGANKLLLHPASLLAAIVATALFQMGGSEAVANTINPKALADDANDGGGTDAGKHDAPHKGGVNSVWTDRQIAAVAAAMIALAVHEYSQLDSGSASVVASLGDFIPEHITLSRSVVANAPAAIDADAHATAVSLLELSRTAGLDGHDWQSGGSIVTQFWSNSTLQPMQFLAQSGHATGADGQNSDHAPGATDGLPPAIKLTMTMSTGSHGEFSSLFVDDAFIQPPRATSAAAPPQGAVAPTTTASTTKPTETQHVSAKSAVMDTVGSATPQVAEEQSPFAFLTDKVSSTSKSAILVTGNNLSMQDVVKIGLTDLLGSFIPASAYQVIEKGLGALFSQSSDNASASHETSAIQPTITVASVVDLTTSGSSSTTLGSSTTTLQTSPSSSVPSVTLPALTTSTTTAAVSNPQAVGADLSFHFRIFDKFDETGLKMLSTFTSTNSYARFESGSALVYFDIDPTHFASPDLVSATWKLPGGYTMSIVGLLPHDLAVLV